MENLQPHQILVPLAIALVIGIVVLVWGDRPGLAAAVRAWFGPSADDNLPEDAPEQLPAQPRSEWQSVKRFSVSEPSAPAALCQVGAVRGGDQRIADQVAAPSTEAGQLIAKPSTPDNAQLPGNAVNSALPIEARDIIRATALAQGKAEAVAMLLKAGRLTNKAEAIEQVFGCSRSSRPGSPYQQALALIEPLLTVEKYPGRTPDQEEFRQRMELT